MLALWAFRTPLVQSCRRRLPADLFFHCPGLVALPHIGHHSFLLYPERRHLAQSTADFCPSQAVRSPGPTFIGMDAASSDSVAVETPSEQNTSHAEPPQKRRRHRNAFKCPGCGNGSHSVERLLPHMNKCCCDLLPKELQGPGLQIGQLNLESMLEAAERQELQLRMQVLALSRALKAKAATALATTAQMLEDDATATSLILDCNVQELWQQQHGAEQQQEAGREQQQQQEQQKHGRKKQQEAEQQQQQERQQQGSKQQQEVKQQQEQLADAASTPRAIAGQHLAARSHCSTSANLEYANAGSNHAAVCASSQQATVAEPVKVSQPGMGGSPEEAQASAQQQGQQKKKKQEQRNQQQQQCQEDLIGQLSAMLGLPETR